ncbi:uncharacterized protein LOC143427110 [Xylocopa sonorina]|uniref:uncharacterized protein LOC143427110 n=1 Tax=Xylocopa sonorina TaxID=1818115 RepID=UPI00403B2AE8
METLESSRVCRLCGKQSGISINIFDENENHTKKINAILPIMVHEMDLLPKHMCHRCSYKLEEFHKFYVDCLRTDADLKSQLSWMRKDDSKERVGVPMVHIENIKIKVEPPDYDLYNVDPIVDNVDYINSMSSVTFPVNGVQTNDIPERITYTAYTRCGCYCDKADQSNQTVSTNREDRISRCNRVNDVRSSDGCANDSEAVKVRSLASRTLGKRSNLVGLVNEVRNPSSFATSNSKSNRINGEASRGTIVRNLRPRKVSVDYAGTRRKPVPLISSTKGNQKPENVEVKIAPSIDFGVRQIKAEKVDGYEGRILRPRNGTIDYIGPKRKYSRSADKNQRSLKREHRSDETKVRNIASKLKLPSRKVSKSRENRVNLSIKEEQLSDLEDMVLVQSVSAAMLSLNRAGDLIEQIYTLPNDCDANLQNDRVNYGAINSTHQADQFGVAEWKGSRHVPKSKLKSEKIDVDRVNGINCPIRYLRSQDACLRSGKIREPNVSGISAGKQRRNLRNLTTNGRTLDTNLIKMSRDPVIAKKTTTPIKLIDIKHYCEECNTCFANKELFKLHDNCYGH